MLISVAEHISSEQSSFFTTCAVEYSSLVLVDLGRLVKLSYSVILMLCLAGIYENERNKTKFEP